MTWHCCFVVLCGLPGSGKSSLAKQLSKSLPGGVHICYDELLSADMEKAILQDQEKDNSLWKAARLHILDHVEGLVRQGLTRVDHGTCISDGVSEFSPVFPHLENTDQVDSEFSITANSQISGFSESSRKTLLDIYSHIDLKFSGIADEFKSRQCCPPVLIIDDNMYYRSMRYQYYQLARKYQMSFCEVFCQCSEDTAFIRNNSRQERVDDHVITSMATKMEVPDPKFFGWEKNVVILDTNTHYEIDCVLALIRDSLAQPVEPLPVVDQEASQRDRIICSQNLLHQIDKMLRRLVSQEMIRSKEEGKLDKKKLGQKAKHLNSVRTEMLDSLRKGELLVPSDQSGGTCCAVNMETGSEEESPCDDMYQFEFIRLEYENRCGL